jgi:hypothetical protein
MVPPNWHHPRDDRGNLRPMYDRNFDDVFAEWLVDFDRIRRGELTNVERNCYAEPGMNPLAEWLRDEGMPPTSDQHRPWRTEDATWVQVWETVSEGTPVTPPFATKAELVDYLVAGGDDWDRKRGRGGYTRAQAEAFVGAGWVPSMVVTRGPSGAQMFNGIESAEVFSGPDPDRKP